MSQPKPQDFTLLLNVFREGLIRGLISAQEIVSWADRIILDTEEPDYFFIEVSLSSNVNPLIEVLNKYVKKNDDPICERVLMGLIYHKYPIYDIEEVEKVAAMIGKMSSCNVLSSFENDTIYTFDEYYVYYLPDSTQLQVELIDFLSTYEPFNLNNYKEWKEINIQVEAVLERKEMEAEVIAASYRKAWEKSKKKQRIKQRLKISIAVISFLALIIIVGITLKYFQIQSASLYMPIIFFLVIITKNIIVEVEKKRG